MPQTRRMTMRTTMSNLSKTSFAGVAVLLLAACAAETPAATEQLAAPSAAARAIGNAGPELGSCDRLRAPEGSSFAYHVYAKGVQIYRWDGQSWLPVGPAAELFANAGGKGLVGTHFAGPRWQSVS